MGFQYIFGICKDIFTIFGKQIPQTTLYVKNGHIKVIHRTGILCLLYLVKSTFSFLRQKISRRIATMFKQKV